MKKLLFLSFFGLFLLACTTDEGDGAPFVTDVVMPPSSQLFAPGDEVTVAARGFEADDDIMLVSRKGMSLKFTANDEQLRPMGRQTAGVQGMKFRDGDELLAMDVVWGDSDKDLLVVTDEGFAKRSAVSEYRLQGRNGYGVKALQLAEGRGSLVGALIVSEDDQVMAIMKSGKVIRSDVAEVKRTGRNTQGVTLAKPDKNDEIISIALNAEKDDADDQNDVQPAQSEQSDSAEQQAEQPADVQNVNTESDGE